MKFPSILLTVLLSIVCSYGVVHYTTHPGLSFSQPIAKETTYQRVIRTGTLRCGYLLWPPFVTLDENTKKLGGFSYAYAEEIGKSLGLKVTWTEVLSGQQIESLRSGKIDAVCGSEGPLMMAASAYLRYAEPMMYVPFYFYTRSGDGRFDHAIDKANRGDVTMVAMDGDSSLDIANRFFPKAKRDSLTASTPSSQLLLDVVTKKADLVLDDCFSGVDFLKSNPDTLQLVSMDHPAMIVPLQISVLHGEGDLAAMLSQAILNLRYRGIEDAIFAKIPDAYQSCLYRASSPFKN